MREKSHLRAVCVLAGILSAVAVTSANAQTVTIGTFADPAVTADPPMFTVDFVNNTIEGSWIGLDLLIDGTSYTNVEFSMPGVPITAYTNPAQKYLGGTTGGGNIKFYPAGQPASVLFSIAFETAHLTTGGFGANEPLLADDVEFGGLVVPTGLTDEVFSFAFANHVLTDEALTTTASFTSSALPEPASLGLLVLGAILFGARPRRRA